MPSKNRFAQNDPFEQQPPAENPMIDAAQNLYGKIDIPDSGRIIARLKPIDQIRPDFAQPRRGIPLMVRGQWDGDPAELPTVLANWHMLVEERLGMQIHLPDVLNGLGDGDDPASEDLAVTDYFELLKLAASIRVEGLINPIRLARGKIESGERRWLAYWLLSLYIDPAYKAIPAVEKDRLDVWAQAAENGARRPLNAIGMARQIARLIMDMYGADDGIEFDEFERIVYPGESDQKFYQQVANGNVFRIKRGFGQRVLDVTGLSSPEAVRLHRALLRIPPGLWVKADEQNWSEWQIREYLANSESTDNSINDDDTVTGVTVSGVSDGATEQPTVPQGTPSVHNTWADAEQKQPSSTPVARNPATSPLYTQPQTRPAPKPTSSKPTRAEAARDEEDDAPAIFVDVGDPWDMESTAAIANEWAMAQHNIVPVLSVLRQLSAAKEDREMLTELLTLSRKDLAEFLSRSNLNWWQQRMDFQGKRLEEMVESLVRQEVRKYFAHLLALGRGLDDKYGNR